MDIERVNAVLVKAIVGLQAGEIEGMTEASFKVPAPKRKKKSCVHRNADGDFNTYDDCVDCMTGCKGKSKEDARGICGGSMFGKKKTEGLDEWNDRDMAKYGKSLIREYSIEFLEALDKAIGKQWVSEKTILSRMKKSGHSPRRGRMTAEILENVLEELRERGLVDFKTGEMFQDSRGAWGHKPTQWKKLR